jgi:hypothetical protein
MIDIKTLKDGEIIESTGIIKFLSFEGGFFGIEGDDGSHYDPKNLSSEFKQDGIKVKFKLKLCLDDISFHMWGIIVEVIEMSAL